MVYSTTDKYRNEKKISLTNQFRRAAVSISLNIAEGNGAGNAENLRYAGIASRSLKECVVCTTTSLRREYIDKPQHDKLRNELAEIGKMLSGLMRYLSAKK